MGDDIDIKWNSSPNIEVIHVDALWGRSSVNIGQGYPASSGGITWDTTDAPYYRFKPQDTYKIRISADIDNLKDESDKIFSIKSCNP